MAQPLGMSRGCGEGHWAGFEQGCMRTVGLIIVAIEAIGLHSCTLAPRADLGGSRRGLKL